MLPGEILIYIGRFNIAEINGNIILTANNTKNCMQQLAAARYHKERNLRKAGD